MPKVRVNGFSVSLDGYAAGPNQSVENPLGVRGPELFEWFFSTRTWRKMHGHEGGSTGVDNDWAQRGMENVGAWILGRNMFGPVRGPWPDDSWKGLGCEFADDIRPSAYANLSARKKRAAPAPDAALSRSHVQETTA